MHQFTGPGHSEAGELIEKTGLVCLVCIDSHRHRGPCLESGNWSRKKGKRGQVHMKKNYVTRIGALALALTLITTSMMGSTLAKYASEAVGTGTVAIAKWDVEMKDGKGELGETFSFTLAGTKNNNSKVAEDVVAPGDTGVIKYIIHDGGNTQVNYTAKIELNTDDLSDIGSVIKFYTDDKYTIPWADIKEEVVAKTSPYTASDIEGNIYWKWVSDSDTEDTKLGESAPTGTFTVTLSAEQDIASVSTAP